MTPGELSEMLARDAERVCGLLLPQGRREGNEWVVGSVHGEEGRSCKVHLTGDKAGVWADFSEGGSGDLIDLWAACRGVPMREALSDIRKHLGVVEPDRGVRPIGRQKTYQPPAVPSDARQPRGEALLWLTRERGISEETIKAFKIAASGARVYFPFLNPDGERMMLKWRSIHEKKTAPTSADQRPCLFGWQAVPDSARTITICEGELDAMALFEYGRPALSVPFGGGKGAKQSWIENEYDNLERFDTIYLAMDNDEAGQEAVVEIVERLGRHRCEIVTLPEKDANACLLSRIPESMIDRAFASAKTLDPDGLRAMSSFGRELDELMFPDPDAPQDWIDLPWPKVRDKLRLRPSELIAVQGINGHGKSHLVNHIALHSVREGARVMLASMEYRPVRLAHELVKAAGGVENPTREYKNALVEWMGNRVMVWGHTGAAKQNELLGVMEYSWKKYGTKIFVIDSLLKCGIAEDDYNSQKLFVERLADFKNRTNTTILLVVHPRKGLDESRPPGKMDVRGSGAISDLVDTLLTIWRNKGKEKAFEIAEATGEPVEEKFSSAPDAILECEKQRLGDWEGGIGLWFHRCGQFLGGPDGKAFQFVHFTNSSERQYV